MSRPLHRPSTDRSPRDRARRRFRPAPEALEPIQLRAGGLAPDAPPAFDSIPSMTQQNTLISGQVSMTSLGGSDWESIDFNSLSATAARTVTSYSSITLAPYGPRFSYDMGPYGGVRPTLSDATVGGVRLAVRSVGGTEGDVINTLKIIQGEEDRYRGRPVATRALSEYTGTIYARIQNDALRTALLPVVDARAQAVVAGRLGPNPAGPWSLDVGGYGHTLPTFDDATSRQVNAAADRLGLTHAQAWSILQTLQGVEARYNDLKARTLREFADNYVGEAAGRVAPGYRPAFAPIFQARAEAVWAHAQAPEGVAPLGVHDARFWQGRAANFDPDLPLVGDTVAGRAARALGRAQLYQSLADTDPTTFRWLTLAADVSRFVGASLGGYAAGGAVAGVQAPFLSPDNPLSRDAIDLLAELNDQIFRTSYWIFDAYRNGGIGLLRELAAKGQLNPTTEQAFELLDHGRATGNQDEVWEGTLRITYVEQVINAQPIYDRHRASAYALGLVTISPLTFLPGPGAGQLSGQEKESFEGYFQRTHGRLGDLGNVNDRWEWASRSLLPAFRRASAINDAARR